MIALHKILGSKVVIKSIPSSVYETKASQNRISEVDAQRKCKSSEFVLGIIDHFVINLTHYIVTKYEVGGDLSAYQAAQGQAILSEAHTLHIFTKIARGLFDIHREGIVHSDIKHKNIFLGCNSRHPKVKIADFGLACKLEEDECFI